MADQTALDTRQQSQPARRFTEEISAFKGPLPPPEILASYNEVVPNGAERILAMAERQQAHRQELEGVVVRGNSRRATRGQVFAFMLGLVAVGGGIFLIANGMDTQGLTSIIAAFTSLAVVFIYGRHQQAKERAEKRREAREAAQQPELPF